MPAQILSQLINSIAVRHLYVSDILDITIISIFLYILFVLFKQSRAFLVLLGISFLVALYFISRLLNLYLSTIALQSLFSVLFLVLVVVFQGEMRKFFEYLGLVGTRRIRSKASSVLPESISEIIQAMVDMADDKMGALFVFPGNDDVSKFIAGGKQLDGLASRSLLLSIFDHHSEGHDGAVIVMGNRISQFGTQLPLSTNFKEVGRHGTRHSAGLGISERTDALAIIISEEKGTISLAQNGKLKTISSPQEVEKELRRHLRLDAFSNRPFTFKSLIRQNIRLKFLALFVALCMWAVVSLRAESVTKSFTVPVTFTNASQTVRIADFSPKQVEVTLQGRGDVAFSALRSDSLNFSVDVSQVNPGLNTIALSTDELKHPNNLSITSIQPQTVSLLVNKYQLFTLPVKVFTVKQVPRGVKLASIESQPPQVEIWLPEGTAAPEFISTLPVDLSTVTTEALIPTQLKLPANAWLENTTDDEVTVAITIQK